MKKRIYTLPDGPFGSDGRYVEIVDPAPTYIGQIPCNDSFVISSVKDTV